MEKWTFKRNGAVEGPVGEDQLRSLYEAGEITGQTLVRSTAKGGGWRRLEEIVDLKPLGAPRRFPRAVSRLWPWFAILTPLLGGLLDVYLIRSQGNAFVESNAWLLHAPLLLNILAVVLWLVLIWREVRHKVRRGRAAEMVLWLVAAPVYQSFTWWGMASVATLINLSLGLGLPECQSDIARALVRQQVEKLVAKRGETGVSAGAVTGVREQWVSDRSRMCAGRVATADERSYSVRYRIDDRGSALFHNTLHGLAVTTFVE